jgi:hypothetical protein
MSFKFLVVYLFIICPFSAGAQMDTLKTIEFMVRSGEYPYYILPVGDKGLVIYRQQYEEVQDEYNNFEFLVYDRDLNKNWESLVRMDYMLNIIHHAYAGDYVYIIFSGTKSFKKRLFIYRLNLVSHTQENIEIETFFPDIISYFDIFGNTMVIGGREKTKPSIVFYNLDDMRPVILQGFYEKNIAIHDIHIDERNELFTVTAGYLDKNRRMSLRIKSYDRQGDPVENIRIEPENGIDFIHAKSLIANSSYRWVAGYYREKKSATVSGLFTISLKLDGTRESRYFPFDDMYTRLDSIEKLSPKTEADLIPGSGFSPDKLEWHVTGLDEFGDDNLIFLESYFTEKGSASFMDKSLIYHYQRALMVALDDKMELNGLNQMGLSPVLSDRLKRNVQVKYYPDSLRLSLFERNFVARKIISSAYTSGPVSYTELGDGHIRGMVESGTREAALDFRSWFGDFYLLAAFLPVKDREIDKKLVLHKIYYP